MPARCGLKGGISRWQRKKQQRKKQRRKRGIKPDAELTAPNFFGVTTLTSTREENLFSSRFFCTYLWRCSMSTELFNHFDGQSHTTATGKPVRDFHRALYFLCAS